MKLSEILIIVVEIVKKFEDAGILTPNGQFAKDVPLVEFGKVAQEIVNVLKAHAVDLPDNVEKVVAALPLILPLLIK